MIHLLIVVNNIIIVNNEKINKTFQDLKEKSKKLKH